MKQIILLISDNEELRWTLLCLTDFGGAEIEFIHGYAIPHGE